MGSKLTYCRLAPSTLAQYNLACFAKHSGWEQVTSEWQPGQQHEFNQPEHWCVTRSSIVLLIATCNEHQSALDCLQQVLNTIGSYVMVLVTAAAAAAAVRIVR